MFCRQLWEDNTAIYFTLLCLVSLVWPKAVYDLGWSYGLDRHTVDWCMINISTDLKTSVVVCVGLAGRHSWGVSHCCSVIVSAETKYRHATVFMPDMAINTAINNLISGNAFPTDLIRAGWWEFSISWVLCGIYLWSRLRHFAVSSIVRFTHSCKLGKKLKFLPFSKKIILCSLSVALVIWQSFLAIFIIVCR